ncbi:MAG TPA: UvrD-helicase domain-containing protein [Usitatibacter sp.]|nr:UvrD-helicase domain-containing protein [Usitatibacter sp.]
MSDANGVPDLRERERAVDPAASFIVQAPAGSGKTELLIQRFLALLARVDRPEEIAAITFTIKAAAEMRGRIFEALGRARREACPETAHEARTWQLARAALARNDTLGWKLEESSDRLRVQTIDALCASLTRQMPVLSQFGAQPESLEDATALYAEAAHNLVLRLEEGGEVGEDVARLLSHVDNNAAEAQRLIADMLMRRDHWIRTLRRARDRRALEKALEESRAAAVARVRALYPRELDAPRADDVAGWIGLANWLLTNDGKWRKANATAQALAKNEPLCRALQWLQVAPPAEYNEAQWGALEAIIRLAPHAVSELQYVFSVRRQCDFVEVAQGALRALETDEGPTDLLLALDYRIRHILVDEFQDTSFTQFDLLERLTSGWEPGDGRTLFVVGDPMQSIYRFREAEVGLFLKAWTEGIGTVSLEPLTLSANFRSQAGIVEWVNRTFEAIMPPREDIHSGAVKYAQSQPVHEREDVAVEVHPFFDGDAQGEATAVTRIASEALSLGSVAILVRNRSHLLAIMPKLREARLAFRAIEIEQLGHRPVVQDLLALARAVSHPGDRTAWLAVLRAPWCGLPLADLHAIASQPETSNIWEGLNDATRAISADGRGRSQVVRDVLGHAIAQRSRTSLRAAVERAWLALGGPACVENATDLEDAEIFLDHLEASESAGALPDLEAFEESLAKLYALPDLAAPDSLQVMTIHKAKGLEFDTVIVPGLGSGGGRDDRKLFMWMETPSRLLLLAPVNPTGSDKDEIYEYVRELDKEKADHENGRMLYVAATRAKRRLHLLGDTKLDDHGHVKQPTKGCLLHKLWPAVERHFVAPPATAAAAWKPPVAAERQATLRRLIPGSLAYQGPPPPAWPAPSQRPPFEAIEFSWVGDTARKVGSVVHRWLQRIAEDEARGWTKKRVERERVAIGRELVARGVIDRELDSAIDRVVTALTATLDDKRGRWILGAQRHARNEYRLSTVAAGVRRMLVIDRVFEDDVGDTWIVDYKTSTHEGGDLEAFLLKEQERYHGQLEGYVAALGKPHARRGLYFPLLKGWREWY